jgi:radical SAM superfamily enzyme YgiQ (UPF0313 family)
MRVLFIYPDVCAFRAGISNAIAQLSSVLKENGIDVSLIHLVKKTNKNWIISRINMIKPDLIAFSSTSIQFNYVKQICEWIKEENNIWTICGGQHTTLEPESSLKESLLDMVCIGEGEEALLELCKSIKENKDRTDIKNIWFKKDGKIIKNTLRPLISDLDKLPMPDYELFNYKELLEQDRGVARVIASRGCPYDCSYCVNSSLRNKYKGQKYVRLKSVNKIISEIKKLTSRYKIRRITFDDEIFLMNKKFVVDFCREYKKKFRIPFMINSRVEYISDDICKALKDAGCKWIAIGIEAANPYLRNKILNKNISNHQIKEACRIIKENGIGLYTFFMIGLPFESEKSLVDNKNMIKEIKPDMMQMTLYYPIQKTPLYELCKKEGLLLNSKKDSYYDEEQTIKMTNISYRKLIKYYTFFEMERLNQFSRRYFKIVYFPIMIGNYISYALFGKVLTLKRLDKIFKMKSNNRVVHK